MPNASAFLAGRAASKADEIAIVDSLPAPAATIPIK
jgi:hypothetical protein